MKRILLPLLSSFLAIASVRADIVFNENFNYVDGVSFVVGTNAIGQTNWFAHSGAGGADSLIRGKQLQVGMNRQADVNRPFPSAFTGSTTNLYVSFTINCTNLPTATPNYFAHFMVNGTVFHCRAWNVAGSLPGTWKLGVTTASTTVGLIRYFPADLATNVDYQVVMQWDPTQGTVALGTLWVNPISSSDTPTFATDTLTPAPAASVMYGFRQPGGAGGANNFNITNLVVATTFEEAATNVWSTNALVPIIVYSPKGGTNFTGQPLLLSGVAAGQGQRDLVYTWLKDGAIYPNPDGNTNTLNFFSPVAGDSGAYRLVATTPFGLSVTSAVANVWVTNAPVPPTITVQPATNTTVYFGQTAQLSVTATGPGTITYTWSYNGGPLGPNVTGDGTPQIAISNVQTNNGTTGTYRVAVSNEFGGLLSSNAVVSAIPISTVSIAFLRTLVDPVTLQAPPNSTTPYRVTGTVTTYTNITTGNTSSYYLQDGTAGINIFATFGSTFRPAQGDIVTFVGIVSSFSTGLELFADTVNRPYTSYSIDSSGNPLPAAVSIPFNLTNAYSFTYIATNLAGSLVKLENVYFGANAGATIGGSTITVTNASGVPFYLSFFSQDLDTAGQILPEFASSVTGVLYGNHPNYSVAVTKFSDIVTLTPPVSLNYSLSGGNLTLTWSDPSFNLQAAGIVSGPYNTIVGATSGFTTNTLADQLYFRLVK